MFASVREDIHGFTYQEASTIKKLGVILLNPGLHAVLLYRLSRWFYLHHMQPISLFISYFNSILTGAQISYRAVIGKGFTIFHPHGTVIGSGSVLGNYCILVHANTIGQHYGDNDRPTIGDHFYAGAGAKIFGKITIGNNVRVGANTVVINSLPDSVTVAIPPAKVMYKAPAAPQPSHHARPFPPREAVLQQLLPLLTSTLGIDRQPDATTEDTVLLGEGVGLDSIELLRLVGAIEEEFHLAIDDSKLEVEHFRTVGTLLTFVQEKLL